MKRDTEVKVEREEHGLNKLLKFKTTEDINIPSNFVNQVIGQEDAVEIIKRAAKQKRHVLLIGEPGTGKSMLGKALSSLLPKEDLMDVLVYPNNDDPNEPLIKLVKAGEGKKIVDKIKIMSKQKLAFPNVLFFIILLIAMATPWWVRSYYGDLMGAASLVSSTIFVLIFMLFLTLSRKIKLPSEDGELIPKLIVDNGNKKTAPFLEATGAHAGALLGDVLHDPLQSGGLGTPPHERVISGMVHKANNGVLFIDEIGSMSPMTQQELLTILQEKKYPITGQSERSSGAMTRTEPVPADFILIAAGNMHNIEKMHPALRSRIKGYGYEIYMNNDMEDDAENREKLAQFVAQEIKNDGKIPHFSRDAVIRIIEEARKRSGMGNKLTLILRELGGLVRVAGDIALEEKAKYVAVEHIEKALKKGSNLEEQITKKIIDIKKRYMLLENKGEKVGRVNGLAVIGSQTSMAGLVLPIEAEITKGNDKTEFIATGKLGEIAKEAIKNVSAIIKKEFGENLKDYDVYIQFLQTYEGVEGDSASIAVAISIISALLKNPIRQNVAMTGSLSVRGEVLAIGGVNAKIEAAIDAELEKVIIPKSNMQDVLMDRYADKIKIIPVERIDEVYEHVFTKKVK